jgi:hypothetical protein
MYKRILLPDIKIHVNDVFWHVNDLLLLHKQRFSLFIVFFSEI